MQLSQATCSACTVLSARSAAQAVLFCGDRKENSKKYAYDAAGRLVKEGDRVYQYGWLDKVTQITEGDKVIRSFRYHMDGQLAAAYDTSNTETFLWDGLALIRRDTTNYLNEPAVTGGNPVIAGEKTLFNDLLGSTLGAKSADGFSAIERDAFGEVKPGETADLGINFFTGKPQVEGLGYTFLFRNYRPDQGKWQTADPLGYPDGWNNFAYVNNGVTMNIDWLGGTLQPCCTISVKGTRTYVYTLGDFVVTNGEQPEVYIFTLYWYATGTEQWFVDSVPCSHGCGHEPHSDYDFVTAPFTGGNPATSIYISETGPLSEDELAEKSLEVQNSLHQSILDTLNDWASKSTTKSFDFYCEE